MKPNLTTLATSALALALANLISTQPTSTNHTTAPRSPKQLCWMKGTIREYCEKLKMLADLHIYEIRDTQRRPILGLDVLGSMRMRDDTILVIPPNATNLDKNLNVDWYPDVGDPRTRGKVLWEYDGCKWWSDEEGKCGACSVHPYMQVPLDCATAFEGLHRLVTWQCSFDC
ncbi:hypothetical protein P280DRAFT_553952 [Massarina eburnea CBS 473.64]|uniref:Uncharacterized protein n=1 Tax=Massarina eburnea CBS 473.64 TaxID=1395130 RepID=A0A6A6RIB5_9PLEO|nr:hypothetical protein P280DRAFT_553952 [Massarina eburnea CBS 473.64]